MKILSLLIGIFLSGLGIYQSLKYIFDYNNLTYYGKGFVWGSALLIFIGVLLIYLSIKKKK